jgi:hypothetical protein
MRLIPDLDVIEVRRGVIYTCTMGMCTMLVMHHHHSTLSLSPLCPHAHFRLAYLPRLLSPIEHCRCHHLVMTLDLVRLDCPIHTLLLIPTTSRV